MPALRMAVKFLMVPPRKMSYQPPMLYAGTEIDGYDSSIEIRLQ